jgi:UDP-galactopyranose mutase
VHEPLPVLTYSHLRWDFVYQRPQHVLSRLAARRQVIVVEETIGDSQTPYLDLSRPAPGLIRCIPHGVAGAAGFPTSPPIVALLRELLHAECGAKRSHVAWFYTPMAMPLAGLLAPSAVVYDCMDELSAFLGAPPEILEREAALLAWSDVVFTGGPSLYRAKRVRHPNVHCFPSSVDVGHFGAAREDTPAADVAALPRPRLGFYGVIDERLDRDLIAAVADARPEWQLVLVGPVVKIDAATLPRRPNIHYLGVRRYEELPSYLAGWDVCLLPFAHNAATRFISPTKTLEYMAAERPIVSTSIRDVAEPYASVVYVADGSKAFVAACEHALASDAAERERRAVAMRDILARTSWDTTVDSMALLLEDAIHCGRAAGRGAIGTPAPARAKGEPPWLHTTPSSSAPALRA